LLQISGKDSKKTAYSSMYGQGDYQFIFQQPCPFDVYI